MYIRLHGWLRLWRRQIGYIQQIDIDDQIGFCRNSGATGARGDIPIAKSKLPGNKDAALAVNLHAL